MLISASEVVGYGCFCLIGFNCFTIFGDKPNSVLSEYDVVENHSGQRTGNQESLSKGNTHISGILHMASLCSVNSNEMIFKNLYERLVELTCIKMKGYVVVQQKLMVLIYVLCKNDMEYDPNYEISGIQEPKPLFSVAPIGT